jgi:hypothetical protein
MEGCIRGMRGEGRGGRRARTRRRERPQGGGQMETSAVARGPARPSPTSAAPPTVEGLLHQTPRR